MQEGVCQARTKVLTLNRFNHRMPGRVRLDVCICAIRETGNAQKRMEEADVSYGVRQGSGIH